METLSFWEFLFVHGFLIWVYNAIQFFPLLAPAYLGLAGAWQRWTRQKSHRGFLSLALATLFFWVSFLPMFVHCLHMGLVRWDGHNPGHHAQVVWMGLLWFLFGFYLYRNRPKLRVAQELG